MPQNRLVLGDWNVICDVCGLKHKASELRKDWRGLMVCTQDWETRHPQDFLRVPIDNPAVAWARPEGPDQFTPTTYICLPENKPGIAGIGVAGCAIAGSPSGVAINRTAVAGRAIAGIAVAGMNT